MSLRRYCWIGLCLYAALSVADWTLTYTLLETHPGASESNPVAAAFLEKHGWSGLAVFKALVVAVFAGAVVLILNRRPNVAAVVTTLGCAALVWVTTYSQGLLTEYRSEVARLKADVWDARIMPRNYSGLDGGNWQPLPLPPAPLQHPRTIPEGRRRNSFTQ